MEVIILHVAILQVKIIDALSVTNLKVKEDVDVFSLKIISLK